MNRTMRQICIAWALAVLLNSSVWGESEGCVAYWPFDEAQGKVAHDTSGNRDDEISEARGSLRVPKVMRFDLMESTTLLTAVS